MIKFDPTLLSVQLVQLKSVTTALGGSINVIDEKRSTSTKEVMKRIEVPMSVARSFIMATKKVTKYLKPVWCALVVYDGKRILAMERHPLSGLGERFEEDGTEWKPMSYLNIESFIKPLMRRNDRNWFFDGRYIYSFANADLDQVVRGGEYLTMNGQFRKVIALSIDTQELQFHEKIEPVERSCMAFVASNGDFGISPPIWKNLSDVGGRQLSRVAAAGVDMGDDSEDDDEDDENTRGDVGNKFTFDAIDEHLSVNLNFALSAGKEIGKTFGYEYVEPLELPRLMIELSTVNLPNVPKQVKHTYDAGIKFTHALAWLLGLSRKANNLETYTMMRSLMKYLTKKGIYRSTTFQSENVFVVGQDVTTVPLMKLEDLVSDKDLISQSLAAVIQGARRGTRRGKNGVSSFGSLANDNDPTDHD